MAARGDADRKDSIITMSTMASDTSEMTEGTADAGILEKSGAALDVPVSDYTRQEQNSWTPHTADVNHVDVLHKGFDIIAFGATCLAAVQAQVMSTTSSIPDSTAIRIVNTFYLSGLIFDLITACLAFLTSRWLQRLTNLEKTYLQDVFSAQAKAASEAGTLKLSFVPEYSQHLDQNSLVTPSTPNSNQGCLSLWEKILVPWFGLALFVPMSFLVLGGVCILAGLYTYTWSQQPLPVAVVVSFAGFSTLPFIIGVFAIGRVDGRRKRIIHRLSQIQGDW